MRYSLGLLAMAGALMAAHVQAADNNKKCQKSEEYAASAFASGQKSCLAAGDALSVADCHLKNTRALAAYACLPATKATAKVQNFLYQQQRMLLRAQQEQRLTPEEFQTLNEKNQEELAQELRNGQKAMRGELKGMTEKQARLYAQDRIDKGALALGWQPLPHKGKGAAPDVLRYEFKGRTIACGPRGDVLACK